MRISDWSSDVCSSDLREDAPEGRPHPHGAFRREDRPVREDDRLVSDLLRRGGRVLERDSDLPDVRPGTSSRRHREHAQIGRESCRERVCKYVSISVVAVSFKKKKKKNKRR